MRMIGDDVGRGHAVVRRVERVAAVGASREVRCRQPPSRSGCWASALRGDRRREAAAERRGVGQQVRLVVALLIGREDVRPAFAAAEEREEPRRLTSRDARPLQIGEIDVGAGAGRVEAAAVFELISSIAAQHAVRRCSGERRSDIETRGQSRRRYAVGSAGRQGQPEQLPPRRVRPSIALLEIAASISAMT